MKRPGEIEMVWNGKELVPEGSLPVHMMLVDVHWAFEKAGRLPGKALHVALALVAAARLRGSGIGIVLPRWVLELGWIGEWALREGLHRLEQAGVVQVDRQQGRKPRVTLIGWDSQRQVIGGLDGAS